MSQPTSSPLSIASLVDGPLPNTANKNIISCMNCRTTTTPLWRRDPKSGEHLCNRCGLYLKTYNVMHPLTRIKRRAINTPARNYHTQTTTAATKQQQQQQPPPPSPSPSMANVGKEMDDVEQIPRPANCHPPQLQQLRNSSSNSQQPRAKRVTPKQQISQGLVPLCFNCRADKTPLWRRDPDDNIICNACGLYYKLHGQARPVSMKRAAIRRRNRTTIVTSGTIEQLPRSVPSFTPKDPPLPQQPDMSMGGLGFLMQAAEMRPLSSKEPPRQSSGSSNCVKLESLAAAAAAASAEKPAGVVMAEKERQQHLEYLFAKPNEVLRSLD